MKKKWDKNKKITRKKKSISIIELPAHRTEKETKHIVIANNNKNYSVKKSTVQKKNLCKY